VESFALQIKSARSLMDDGQYQKAFDLIVDQDVHSLPDLLGKIECLIDIGFILRDEKILRYGLYLLEKHGSEVLEVPDLGPLYFLNLGHQYANMVTLSSFGDEYYGFFMRAEQVKAREYYHRVLSYESVSPDVMFEAWKGLGQMYQSSGRGLEALESYQKALKIKPASREILHEKIRLMREYSLPSLPNREEFLQEAWALMVKSSESRDTDEDDQEDEILKSRLTGSGLDRSVLETPGEYPLHSVVTHSEEEHFHKNFCNDNRLFLNLCSFCRKCEFSLGDTLELSSSSLTILSGQKKRFVRLNRQYRLIREGFAAGRYLLTDALSPGRNKDYLFRSYPDEQRPSGFTRKGLNFFQLKSAFETGWSLWDTAGEFLSIFWGMDNPGSLESLFFSGKTVRSEWFQKKSPSLHGVFELYAECMYGADRTLGRTYEILRKGPESWMDMNPEDLGNESIKLYGKLNLMIQYLGVMHERNEFNPGIWDFPRPLYNFVSIKEDIKSK